MRRQNLFAFLPILPRRYSVFLRVFSVSPTVSSDIIRKFVPEIAGLLEKTKKQQTMIQRMTGFRSLVRSLRVGSSSPTKVNNFFHYLVTGIYQIVTD